MHIHIILCPVSEEQIHPGFRKELHGHGMCFCRFHGNIRMLIDRVICNDISLECVSALMCDDIGVAAGAVEIGKNERRSVIRQIGHITACFLGFSAKYIKQIVVTHEVHELCSFR